MSIELLQKLLAIISEKGINDLHLSVGALPSVRKNGEVHFLNQLTPISLAEMDSIIKLVVKPELQEELNRSNHLAFAYSIPARGVIASMHIGSVELLQSHSAQQLHGAG